jgi:hypothetical protein
MNEEEVLLILHAYWVAWKLHEVHVKVNTELAALIESAWAAVNVPIFVTDVRRSDESDCEEMTIGPLLPALVTVTLYTLIVDDDTVKSCTTPFLDCTPNPLRVTEEALKPTPVMI